MDDITSGEETSIVGIFDSGDGTWSQQVKEVRKMKHLDFSPICAVCKTKSAELDDRGVWQPCEEDRNLGWILVQIPENEGE